MTDLPTTGTRDAVLEVLGRTFPDAASSDLAALRAGEEPWTSLGHLQLMMALEARFGRAVPADRFGDLVTLDAIVEHFSA